MNIQQMIDNTKGRFFTVTFLKKDGTTRVLNGRVGVRVNLTGAGLNYNPARYGYVVVYDVKAKGYRMVNTNTITAFKCGSMEVKQ